MSVDLDELRIDERIAAENVVSVSYMNAEAGNREENHKCRSQDVSAGGLKLTSHRPLSLGVELPMEIDLGDFGAVIEVVGQVKWCLEIDDAPTYFIGVKLVKVEKSNLQVWKKYLSQH